MGNACSNETASITCIPLFSSVSAITFLDLLSLSMTNTIGHGLVSKSEGKASGSGELDVSRIPFLFVTTVSGSATTK